MPQAVAEQLDTLRTETQSNIDSVFSVRTGPLRSYMDVGEWPADISVLCGYAAGLWCTDEVISAPPLSHQPWWLGAASASLACEQLDAVWKLKDQEEQSGQLVSAIFVGHEEDSARPMLMAGARADAGITYCESSTIRGRSMYDDPQLGAHAGAFGAEVTLAAQTDLFHLSDSGRRLTDHEQALVEGTVELRDQPANGLVAIDSSGKRELFPAGLGTSDLFGRVRAILQTSNAQAAALYLMGFNGEPDRVLLASNDGAFAVIDEMAYEMRNPVADLMLAGIGYRDASLTVRLCVASLHAALGILTLTDREVEDPSVAMRPKHSGLRPPAALGLNIARRYAKLGRMHEQKLLGGKAALSAEEIREQLAAQVRELVSG